MAYQRFAPVLRYLVEVKGLYCHPSRTGFTAGQGAWADVSLQFFVYGDAKDYAKKVNGEVIKLRVYAKLEPIKHANKQVKWDG